MSENGKCDCCGENEEQELHTCPYGCEINGDYSECNCCKQCEQNCSDEI